MEQRERTRETERRRATILFPDITGFTSRSEQMDPEDVFEIIRPAVLLLDEIARKHGGAVDKYQGDCIMAMFGVPFAVEDAARAAINAAIEMRERIEDYSRERGLDPPLRIHSGVDSGLVVSGDVTGLAIQVEFSVLGDAVNVASRLKEMAPAGSIWVGPETHRYTREVFEFAALQPIRLRGKAVKVPVYEVLSRKPRLHRAAPLSANRLHAGFVGREKELAQVRERLLQAREGRGGVLRVVGPAGVGKSRLLAEIRTSDPARDMTWLQARALSIGENLSFHLFADLIRGWADLREEEPEAEAFAQLERRVEELFGGESREVLPFLATFLGLCSPSGPVSPVEAIEGEAMGKALLGAVSRLLRRLADERPVVVCLDDLHWADGSSIDLLLPLLRLVRTHLVFFLLVHRPEVRESLTQMISAARSVAPDLWRELRLGPLDAAASRDLQDQLFRGDLPRPAREHIEERAQGNPFYLEEIVRALIDEGAVERTEGGLRATAKLESTVIPASVQEVIMVRVDRLPLGPRGVLQTAAILGRSCQRRILERIVESASLDAHLERLVEAEFLVRHERLGDTIYDFKHPMIQEVVYEGIALETRRRLHLRAAESIERVLPETHPGYDAMLAYHFIFAGDRANAELYLLRAGEKASRIAASSEALNFLRVASKLYMHSHGEGGDAQRRARVEKQIALAFFNRGRMVDGDEHFDNALRLLGERVPASSWQRKLRYGTTLLHVLIELYLGRDTRRRRAPTDRDREVIEMMFLRAQAQTTADPVRFLFDTMENLRRLDQVNPHTIENAGGMYASTVGYFAYSGIALGIGKRLLELSSSLVQPGNPREQFRFQTMNFVHQVLRGDWDERHVVDSELVELNLRLGQLWWVINYLPLDARRRVHQGRFAEAEAAIGRIAKIEDLYAYDLARSNRLAVTMYLRLEQRRLDEALHAANEHYEGFQEDLLNVLALGTRARIERLLGDRKAATETLERCRAIVRRTSFLPPFQMSEFLLGELALALDELEDALSRGDRTATRELRRNVIRQARRTLATARKVAWQRPEGFRLAGRAAWLVGRRRRALELWRRSLDEAERLRMRPELGRSLVEVGARLGGSAPGPPLELDTGGCFDRASEIFREHGLEWDLERLAEAREKRSATLVV